MACKGTVVQVQATAHYHENKSANRGIYTDVEQDVDMDNQPFTNSDADTMTPSASDGEIEASEEEEEDESRVGGGGTGGGSTCCPGAADGDGPADNAERGYGHDKGVQAVPRSNRHGRN